MDELGTFEETFRALLPRALGVARRLLGDESLAEDAAAEAFARAHASWRRIGRLEYRDAWILRVTANVAVDIARKRSKTVSVGLAVSSQALTESGHDESVAMALTVAAALSRLPKRQREIMVLQHFERMSEGEIAAWLGVSAGTVKKDGFRARQALRERLGESVVDRLEPRGALDPDQL